MNNAVDGEHRDFVEVVPVDSGENRFYRYAGTLPAADFDRGAILWHSAFLDASRAGTAPRMSRAGATGLTLTIPTRYGARPSDGQSDCLFTDSPISAVSIVFSRTERRSALDPPVTGSADERRCSGESKGKEVL